MKYERALKRDDDEEPMAAAIARARKMMSAGEGAEHRVVSEWLRTWGTDDRRTFREWLAAWDG